MGEVRANKSFFSKIYFHPCGAYFTWLFLDRCRYHNHLNYAYGGTNNKNTAFKEFSIMKRFS